MEPAIAMSGAASRRRGRPRRVDEVSTARVWALLTAAERRDLAVVARENGVTIAVFIRDAVNDAVCEYRERPVFSCTGNSADR